MHKKTAASKFWSGGLFMSFVIIQHDKARSASDRPATRDAQHPESGVLNSYCHL